MKLYDSLVAQIIWDEKGVFICKLKDSKSAYDADELKNQFNFINKHSHGKPYKVILDTSGSFNFPTDESFEYFFRNYKLENRLAIVTDTLSMRILIEQMFRYNKVTNASFFKTSKGALDWIIDQ